jgi:hypothetical protein
MSRKNQAVIAAFVLFVFVSTMAGCGLLSRKRGPRFSNDLKSKVAVMPFADTAGLGRPNIDREVADQLAAQLVDSGDVVTVSWEVVESYMAAKGIPMPLTEATIPMVGRGLGLNAVVLGAISEISQVQKQTGWLSFIPIDIPYLSEANEVTTAVLVAKVVDVDNGVVLGADVGKGETKAGLADEDFMMGKNSQSIDQAQWSKSMATAVRAVSDRVLRALANSPWKTFVVEVSGDQAVISAGQDVGIDTGDTFTVYGVDEKIINAAGQTYVVPGAAKAELEAIQVTADKTTVKIVSGEVHPGDAARYMD